MEKALGLISIGLMLVAAFFFRFPTIDESSRTIVDGKTVSLNLVDSADGKAVPMARLYLFPDLALIASPGTGASGPRVHELKSPSLAFIVGQAPGYRPTFSITVLKPGHRYKISITKS